ncbi:MAG TPA: hypothetical protein VLB67_10675 [Acidimicrobiia bacterium]|nr:hypothetical protein [Acidimicrobiia bacterium]
MAPAAASDATVPPLIEERIARIRRLLVSVSASPDTVSVAARLGASHGIPIERVVTVGTEVLADPSPSDLYLHGLPDVFGRLLAPPSDRDWVIVRDRAAAPLVEFGGPLIETGTARDGRAIAGALRVLFKPLCQQRSVRPLFAEPPPLGLPFVAPHGVRLDDSFARPEAVELPGLPDLVVVRAFRDPSPTAPALVGSVMVIR